MDRAALIVAGIVFATISASMANATDWRSAGKNSNDSEYFIDVDSMTSVGKLVRFWRKVDYSKPTVSGGAGYSTIATVDCDTMSVTDIQTHFKKMDGEVITQDDNKTLFPTPGSMLHALAEQVCKISGR